MRWSLRREDQEGVRETREKARKKRREEKSMITDFTDSTDGRKNDGEKKGSLGEEKTRSNRSPVWLRVFWPHPIPLVFLSVQFV